jgi:hypothetical protein
MLRTNDLYPMLHVYIKYSMFRRRTARQTVLHNLLIYNKISSGPQLCNMWLACHLKQLKSGLTGPVALSGIKRNSLIEYIRSFHYVQQSAYIMVIPGTSEP